MALEPCGFSSILLLLIGGMCSMRDLWPRLRCCIVGLRRRSSQIRWQTVSLLVRHLVTKSHRQSETLISCRYGAARDWQVQVAAHRPGHRRRDGGCLGGAAVFRQLRYVWKLFSGGFYSVAAPFSAVLHLHPAPLMNKQDLFRLEKGGKRCWGRGGDQCCTFVRLCVWIMEKHMVQLEYRFHVKGSDGGGSNGAVIAPVNVISA